MRARIFWFLALAACQSQGTDMGRERIAPGACATCHMPEYKTAKDHEGDKPTTCGICHSQMTWSPSRIDHPWPLTGAHGKNHCLWCHRSAKEGEPPKFTGTKKECWGCHKADYQRSEYPDHETFQHTCEDCHTTTSWSPTLTNANIPPPIPTIEDVPDSGPPPILDAGAKPLPTIIRKPPPPKKDSGVDIITHPSGHHGGGEEE